MINPAELKEAIEYATLRATIATQAERIERYETALKACQLLAGDVLPDFEEGSLAWETFADIHLTAVRGLTNPGVVNEASLAKGGNG